MIPAATTTEVATVAFTGLGSAAVVAVPFGAWLYRMDQRTRRNEAALRILVDELADTSASEVIEP